jgi:hypothetical protein
VNSAPVHAILPAISGIATQGQTLSGTRGTWTGNVPITYTRAWLRCDTSGSDCNPIPNATAATYKLQRADVGFTIELQIAGSNSYGSSDAASVATSVVQGLPPSNAARPTVSGAATVGQTLSGTLGSWTGFTPISYTRAWLRCDTSGSNCSLIPKDVSGQYTLRSTDIGFTIEFQVTASNGYGGSVTAASLPTAVVH